MNEFASILVAILGTGTLSSIVTYILTRRKLAAEEADTYADAIQKLTANNTSLQDENQKLYKDNTALEKALTDSDRARENLAVRLETRDSQISTLSRQLSALQNREKQGEITQALQAQLAGITSIKQAFEKIIDERDRTIRELMARTGQTGPLPPTPRDHKK